MKKIEVLVDDADTKELTSLLQQFPYVKGVKENDNPVSAYTLVSEQALAQDWLLAEDDELQTLYNK